jgi:hypothetical protein
VVVVGLRELVVVGAGVVVDEAGAEVVGGSLVLVAVEELGELLVSTTGAGLSGDGLDCAAGLLDRVATAANTVATTIPATPRAA